MLKLTRKYLSSFLPHRFSEDVGYDPDFTMKAVVMRVHGDSSVLKFDEHCASPRPSDGSRQLIIDVVAAGVNPLDIKMRIGPISSIVYPKPKIVGSDVSGVVSRAPPNSSFVVGDRVFAMLPLLGTTFGGYAGRCCVSEEFVARAPDNVPLVELAAIPLVACTVLQALRPVIASYGGEQHLRGRKCFIQGGSGGLGHIAVQYCAHVLGMHVSTTCSPAHFGLLRSYGASEVIDYHTPRWEEGLLDLDVFIDTMGHVYEDIVYSASSRIMRRTGEPPSHYVRIASSPYRRDAKDPLSRDQLGLAIPEARLDRMLVGYLREWYRGLFSSIKYHFVLVHPEREALRLIGEAVSHGSIRVNVQAVIPLDQAASAHDLQEDPQSSGKVVISVDPVTVLQEQHLRPDGYYVRPT